LKKQIDSNMTRNRSLVSCRVFSKNITNHLYLRQNNIEQFIISIVLQIGSFTWNIWYYDSVHDSKKYVNILILIHLRFLDCTTVVCMDTPYVSWEILFI